MKRVEKFLQQGICPCCNGTRLSERARAPRLRGSSMDQVRALPLSELHGILIEYRMSAPCTFQFPVYVAVALFLGHATHVIIHDDPLTEGFMGTLVQGSIQAELSHQKHDIEGRVYTRP